MKEPIKTKYYSMKRLIPDDEKKSGKPSHEDTKWMVVLHTEDGGTEWVDTLYKRPFAHNAVPVMYDDKKMALWKSKKSVIKKSNRQPTDPKFWISQNFDDVKCTQVKWAFDKSVVSHMKLVREQNSPPA